MVGRWRDESIRIGDDIVIEVVEVEGLRVQLAVTTPAGVTVSPVEPRSKD